MDIEKEIETYKKIWNTRKSQILKDHAKERNILCIDIKLGRIKKGTIKGIPNFR